MICLQGTPHCVGYTIQPTITSMLRPKSPSLPPHRFRPSMSTQIPNRRGSERQRASPPSADVSRPRAPVLAVNLRVLPATCIEYSESGLFSRICFIDSPIFVSSSTAQLTWVAHFRRLSPHSTPVMAVPQRLVPSTDDLREFYVGKDINDVPKPAVVLDRAKVRRHCQSLLEAVDSLGVDFRAHVKTHKVSRLQLHKAVLRHEI